MKAGDWVISTATLPNGRTIKAISYLLEEREDAYITVGCKKYGGIVFVLHKDNVRPMKSSVEKEDLLVLINLALDMKDKKWFDELSRHLQELGE